jgi:hypothetical protein
MKMNIYFLMSISNHQIISLILILAGIIILLLAFKAIIRSKASLTWPCVEGEILKSNLEVSHHITDSDSGKTYNPNVEYSYKVQYSVFTSTRIYFGSKIGNSYKEEKSRELLRRYKANQNAKVFYDQDNPKISVLEPGYHSELTLGLIIGVLIIIIGLVFLHLKL